MNRKSFIDMGMEVAKAVASRSEDIHRKVGCCILDKSGRILSTGYNGIYPKQNKSIKFWQNRDQRREYVIHAEVNALSCISRYDNPHTLVSTLLPCSSCAINIASYGIKNVFYLETYDKDPKAFDVFSFYKIKLTQYNN